MYRSATLHHRFGAARLDGRVLEVPELAALLAEDLDPGQPAGALLERVEASLAAVRLYLEQRADDVERLWSAAPLGFADTEQALLLGRKPRVFRLLRDHDAFQQL